MLAPPPPTLESLPAGAILYAGMGTATVLPDADFETYSEAGFVWNAARQAWDGPPNAPQNKKGLPVVGAAVYALHPSTEVLSLAYDLKDGRGRRRWLPGDPPPSDLFAHLAAGGLLEAWNSGFEHWIWNHVCVPKYGWPLLPLRQLRCAMAKARAFALPGALGKAADVLQLKNRKDADGDRLLKKFSVPRNPTKNDPRWRIKPADDPTDAARLYAYNAGDIAAEAEASSLVPDLSAEELEIWLADQEINYRGVAVDAKAVADCIAIVSEAFDLYNAEIKMLTMGAVEKASQLDRLKAWLATRGVHVAGLDEDALDELLGKGPASLLTTDTLTRRVLEIRQLIGSASIKKLFAITNQKTLANRLHDLFSYHAARTGRATGNGPQPHNLPKAGPDVYKCHACHHYFGAHTEQCPWCAAMVPLDLLKPQEWTADCIDDALAVLATRSLAAVEMYFGNACQLIVGCLRGLFVAADGHDLIASDYSAIEGVVTAALAGEQWRLEVFRAKEDIYLYAASKITGVSVETYKEYKKRTGKHHPDRQPFGKIAELSSGFGGWIGAWLSFGAGEFFTDDEIKRHILAWRDASPAIVEFWGGQYRGLPWNADYRQEYFGLEGAAVQAVLNPGTEYTVCAQHWAARPVSYVMRGRTLYCRLPSGRYLTYHNARVFAGAGGGLHKEAYGLNYWGWNTNPKMGGFGWVPMDTYGGKLCENVVQAVARDILMHAIVKLQRAGYPVVLHVHDEIVAEIVKGWGSVEEFERLMGELPDWANGWPLRAAGGWRGHRYRKD